MKIEMVAVSKLKLLDHNPRSISKEQMEKLCKSIEDDPEFLQCRPVLVNKTCVYPILNVQDEKDYKRIDTYTVYAGNQRVRAAKKLKLKEIPCIVQSDLSHEIMQARTIKDNKTYGKFDFDVLANEWDIDLLMDCGFTAEELVGGASNMSEIPSSDDDSKKESKTCETCGKKL